MKDRIFPRQGTDKDLFERLTEYISYFDKDWVNTIEGATDEEIKKLEDLYKMVDKNFKIPEYLYSYLKNMGKKNDWFITNFYTSIEDIIEYNEAYLINLYLNDTKDIKYIMFGSYYLDGDPMLIIDLTKNGEISEIGTDEYIADEPNGILKYFIEERYDEKFENFVKDKEYLLEEYNWWKKSVQNGKEGGWFEEWKNEKISKNFKSQSSYEIEPLAKSLENLLFRSAFGIYERFSNYIEIDNDNKNNTKDKNIKNIKNILKKYNLKKAWFNDGEKYYLYGNGVSMYLASYGYEQAGLNYGLRGFITGENKELVEKIHNDIQNCLIK